MKISTIIPAHNEAGNLPLLIKKASIAYKEHDLDGEILLVNDGSTDNTKEVTAKLEKQYPLFRVIHHHVRKGLTEALNTCFKNAKGDILVFLPGDLESDPEEDIPIMLSGFKKGADVVLGWRQNRKGFKRIASKLYNLLSRLLFNIKAHDLNWIKAFKKEVVKDLELRSDWHRYIAILAKAKGYTLSEVKVIAHKRKYGKSKFGAARLFNGILDLLVVKFHVSFIDKPMRFFSSLGILLGLFGFIGSLYILYIKITTGIIGNRVPLIFLVVLLIILGIQFFALGFLSEILVTINEKLKKR